MGSAWVVKRCRRGFRNQASRNTESHGVQRLARLFKQRETMRLWPTPTGFPSVEGTSDYQLP
eukprot:5427765-Heterocapsa_arctica.AAC.1